MRPEFSDNLAFRPIWRGATGTARGRQTEAAKVVAALTSAPDPQPPEPYESRSAPDPKRPEPHESPPDPQPPAKNRAETRSEDWIDYDRREERRIFYEMSAKPGSLCELLAREFRDHYGPDLSAPEIREEYAQALFPKVRQCANGNGLGRLFSDAHIWAKCERWAAWWCSPKRRPSAHSRYTDEAADRGRATQARSADRDAIQAQALRLLGHTAAQIREALGCSIRKVRYLYKRPVSTTALLKAIQRGVQSVKDCSVQARNLVEISSQYRQPPRQPRTTEQVARPERRDSPTAWRLWLLNAAQLLQLWKNNAHDRPGFRYQSGQFFEDSALYC